jgi:hypothetical protein
MDIREHLKSLPISKLKDLARRHNKLYRIKIGQTKDELVESLAKQYEKFTGTNLIPRHGIDLVVEPIKITKKQLAKPVPAARTAPLPVFIKATPALKEKVRKYNEARLAKQEAEKQITEVIKQVAPVIKEVESKAVTPELQEEPTKAEKGLASLVQSKISKEEDKNITKQISAQFKEIAKLNAKKNSGEYNKQDVDKFFDITNRIILNINQHLSNEFRKYSREVLKNSLNNNYDANRKLEKEWRADNEDYFDMYNFINKIKSKLSSYNNIKTHFNLGGLDSFNRLSELNYKYYSDIAYTLRSMDEMLAHSLKNKSINAGDTIERINAIIAKKDDLLPLEIKALEKYKELLQDKKAVKILESGIKAHNKKYPYYQLKIIKL